MSFHEKYIPKTWNDIIGQEHIIKKLSSYKSIKDVPNLMFIGPPGSGKTACAYVLAHTLNIPLIELNASDERGIDTVRTKIKNMLKTSGERIILLDEFDSTTNDAQHALRRPFEESLKYTNNRVILTVNRSWKIIDALFSRCSDYYFNPLSDDDIKRVALRVLKGEQITLPSREEVIETLNLLAKISHGDARKTINNIEKIIDLAPEDIIPTLKRESVKTDLAEETLNYAINGNWEKCLESLENLIVQIKGNSMDVIEIYWNGLKNLDIDPVLKFPLYRNLADVERSLQMQCNPLIQFSGFLMSITAITHTKI